MGMTVAVQKFGRLPDIDAAQTNEDVWDGTGAYSFLSAAATMTISSESANDANAGTGANTVRVMGLNSLWEEISLDATMNGTSGVTLTTDLLRVYRAYVLTAGTVATNDDNIWIGTGTITAGVPANAYAGILDDMGQTLMAIYTIPIKLSDGTDINGGTLTRWYGTVGAGQAAYATVALQTRANGGAWRTRRVAGIGEGGWMNDEIQHGIALGTKTDIRIRVLSNGVNNSTVEAGFDLDLHQATAS